METEELILRKDQENFSLEKESFDRAMVYAELVANSGMVAECYKGKPGAVLVAWDLGQALGLSRGQSLQAIAVVGNQASVWGDAALAIVMRHAEFNDIGEQETEEIEKTGEAVCIISRKYKSGAVKTIRRKFSLKNAKQAKLIRNGMDERAAWFRYPERMLQMRARSWAMRDLFPDALKGLKIYEEQRDVYESKVGEIIEKQKEIAEPQPITEEGTKSGFWKSLFPPYKKITNEEVKATWGQKGEPEPETLETVLTRKAEKEAAEKITKPPTIHELQKILDEPDDANKIVVNPDGSVGTVPTTPAEDYKLLGFISPEQVHKFWVWAQEKRISTEFILEELEKRELATVEELPENKAEEFCREILSKWNAKK